MPYRYPTQLEHGPSHAAHHNRQHWQPGLYDNIQHGGSAGDWRANARSQSPEVKGRHQLIKSSAVGTSHLNASAMTNTPHCASLDRGVPRVQDESTRDATSRRPTKTSTSDRSEATASSRSDASSPRSIAEDLRGLSLGEHVSSQLNSPHGASPRNQRWDPILGDVQRNLDSLVVSLILSCPDKNS